MKLVVPLVGLAVLGTAAYAVTAKVLPPPSSTPVQIASLTAQAVPGEVADPAAARAADAFSGSSAQADSERELSLVERLAEVPKGGFDPLSIPLEDGIVWYGTWEDAMAEKERTGKPVMLHFGSPRCPSSLKVCVPGVW